MKSDVFEGWLGFGPLLLILAIALFAVDPLASYGYGGVASALASPAIFATAAIAVRNSGRAVWIAFVVWAVLELLGGQATQNHLLRSGMRMVDALFAGLLGLIILKSVMRSQSVKLDTILGSLAVYLILAVFFSSIYSALELAIPGSFLDDGQPLKQSEARLLGGGIFPALTYYSVVTMTTLGYGDVVPTTAIARSLAGAQAVIGQFYVTVLIAFLVGVYTATAGRPESQPRK